MKNRWIAVATLLMLFSILAACGTPETATTPADTAAEATEPTEVPVQEEPQTTEAPAQEAPEVTEAPAVEGPVETETEATEASEETEAADATSDPVTDATVATDGTETTNAPFVPEVTSEPQSITLGAYTTPREAYGEIIPLFQEYWTGLGGGEVTFEESYLGSGAQSRAIVEGFDADIAALSLEADITRIVDAGLITHDWKSINNNGIVSTSVVAFAVREGNPKGIQDWVDLSGEGIEVLTPNPATSGGAMWNVLALYGAALRGQVEGVSEGDEAAATEFLKSVLRNVSVMDKGARESMTTFENGIGDVAITYENEVLVAQQAGQAMELVIPSSSILIENPIALIDASVEKHGNRAVVEAFINFLFTPEVQEVFAKHGLRSVDPTVAEATTADYPALEDQFTIEEFGGWPEATPRFFGETGIFTTAIAEVQQ